jgi:hypothetical protein
MAFGIQHSAALAFTLRTPSDTETQMLGFPKNHHAEKWGSHGLTPEVEIPPGRQGMGTVWPGEKEIPCETLRGLTTRRRTHPPGCPGRLAAGVSAGRKARDKGLAATVAWWTGRTPCRHWPRPAPIQHKQTELECPFFFFLEISACQPRKFQKLPA